MAGLGSDQIQVAGGGGGIANIVEDTTPQLGGDLDANGSDITGVGHIGFLTTQDASAGANDLDDYEEGTWTPGFADDSLDGSGEGQTYAKQVAVYTKIGNKVYIQGTCEITSLGTLTTTQTLSIMGLPFVSNPTINLQASITIGLGASLAIGAGQSIDGIIEPNVSHITVLLWDATAGQTNILISELSAGGRLSFSGSYQV